MGSTVTRIGLNANLYRNTGSYAAPVWDVIDNIRDLSGVGGEADEADASIRSFLGFAAFEPTLIKIALEWNMNEDPADTDWTAIRTAFFGRAPTELLAIDRATGTGAEGIRASFKFFKFVNGQPLNGLQTTDVTAKPCIAANPPAWYIGV